MTESAPGKITPFLSLPFPSNIPQSEDKMVTRGRERVMTMERIPVLPQPPVVT